MTGEDMIGSPSGPNIDFLLQERKELLETVEALKREISLLKCVEDDLKEWKEEAQNWKKKCFRVEKEKLALMTSLQLLGYFTYNEDEEFE